MNTRSIATPLTATLFALVSTLGGFSLIEGAVAQTVTPTATPGVSPTPSSETLSAEGIPNEESLTIDKKRRSPIVTIGTEYVTGNGNVKSVKILADASVLPDEYKGYPIEFKFFVNGLLKETQIRSVQLPRPVGITVAPELASPPFNWTIVATLLHPNRQFITVAQGAVFPEDLTPRKTYNCSVAISADATEESDGSVYVAEGVSATSSNNGFSLSFTTTKLDDGSDASELSASASLTLSGEEASGSVTTSVGGVETTKDVTGIATDVDDLPGSFTVESADTLLSLECEDASLNE